MRLIERPSLAGMTTLGLGGTCAAGLVVESASDLERLSGELDRLALRPYALGLGSNILAMDGHHDLALVRLAPRGAFEVAGEENGKVLVSCPAGLPLPNLLRFCRAQGLSGLQGLAGIPGSVGGAVAMNAGSFGCTIGERLVRAQVWTDGALRTYEAADLELGYRHFGAPGLDGFYLVTMALLALDRAEPEMIAQAMEKTLKVKRERQPVTSRSAGCVFKNPPGGLSAGMLLDQAGFRGRKLGGVQLSEMHANFLINAGGGTATEAVALLTEARAAVAERFGVKLELEVRGVPCLSF